MIAKIMVSSYHVVPDRLQICVVDQGDCDWLELPNPSFDKEASKHPEEGIFDSAKP